MVILDVIKFEDIWKLDLIMFVILEVYLRLKDNKVYFIKWMYIKENFL